ncbi:MAG: hypothetical protein ACLTG4_04700 [Oscillospiraceae bacterium]
MNIKQQFKEGLITNNPVRAAHRHVRHHGHYDQPSTASAWACPCSSS